MKHFIVLGGAGKMGRGIALLLLQLMVQDKEMTLTLLDTDSSLFEGVKGYLRTYLQKYGEKHQVDAQRMEECLQSVDYLTDISECAKADLVFEAIIENIEIKADVLSKVDLAFQGKAIFFTNTSSIPIQVLERRAKLNGRLLGFHFYNPPAVQPLLEMIIPETASRFLCDLGLGMLEKLKKRVIYSNDIAGFIGNGHFMREVVGAWDLVKRLSDQMPLYEAIVLVNTLFQEWLLRPMGIFQLVDYVGVDVCTEILKIMRKYLVDETLRCEYLEQLISHHIRGGQHPDGTQKPGIFEYVDGQPKTVYDLDSGTYRPYKQHALGDCMDDTMTWKLLHKDKECAKKVAAYFQKLALEDSFSAKLAIEMFNQSRRIAENLVKEGVARSLEDVNTVLQLGFYHLWD